MNDNHTKFLRIALCGWLLLLATACTPAAPPPTLTPIPPTSAPTATPAASSEPPTPFQDIAEAQLGEPFTLIWGQTAVLPEAELEIFYEVDIEFECQEDHDCEVPLIWESYFHVTQAGEDLGPFRRKYPETTIGDYTITATDLYQGYDYKDHDFLIELTLLPKDQ